MIDFAQRLAEIEAAAARTEGKLDQLKNKIENIKGPMDELIAQAEATGSAVGNVGGTIVEAVRLSGEAVPTLQGVAWSMYEIQDEMKEKTKTVSTDILDQIAKLLDRTVSGHSLWTKHWLEMARTGEEGGFTLDELAARLEEWFNSPGIIQLNTALHGDIPGFIREFRILMKEIQSGAKDSAQAMEDAARHGAEAFEEAEKRIEKARDAASGMTKAPGSGTSTKGMGAPSSASPGSMGASSGADGQGTGVTTSGLGMALQSLRGRVP